MIEIDNLTEFGLTLNQAKLLNFIINLENRSALSYKVINDEFNKGQSFYWELLDDLVNLGFLTVNRNTKPWKYKYDESGFQKIINNQENEHSKIQLEFETLIKELDASNKEGINFKDVFELLQKVQLQLKLNMDQIFILSSLYTKENGKMVPKTRNINQIKELIKPLNGKLKKHNIRYYLTILETRGFLFSQKVGRSNIYTSKDLLTILKDERELDQKIWEDKKTRLQKIRDFFKNKQNSVVDKSQMVLEKSESISMEINERYQLIDFNLDIVNWVKKLMMSAKKEIFLDFRILAERNPVKLRIAEEFYKSLIDLISQNESSTLKIKLLMYFDSWVMLKLEPIYVKLIQLISQGKLELKVPSETDYRTAKIIIDNSMLLDFMVKQDLAEFDKVLQNRNEMSIKNAKKMFKSLWDSSIDIRDLLMEESISNELEKVTKESINKNPPVYNFKKNEVVITGLKKVLNINLNFIRAAESEILFIGSITLEKNKNSNFRDTRSQSSFYIDFFNILINKCRIGVEVKILRNTIEPNSSEFKNQEKLKKGIQLIMSLSPFFQIRQIDLPQYQFLIIDRKILLIYEFLESGRIKLTIITDKSIIIFLYPVFDRFYPSFERLSASYIGL
ncbi:MAG: hypothetical protein ACFFHV_24085 [Promethearchaeota archaeon]